MANNIPKLIERASNTSYQIRQHRDGTYQVYTNRMTPRSTPYRTARTLDAARRFAQRTP